MSGYVPTGTWNQGREYPREDMRKEDQYLEAHAKAMLAAARAYQQTMERMWPDIEYTELVLVLSDHSNEIDHLWRLITLGLQPKQEKVLAIVTDQVGR